MPGRLGHQLHPCAQIELAILFFGPFRIVSSVTSGGGGGGGGGGDDAGTASSKLTRVNWRVIKDLMVSVRR